MFPHILFVERIGSTICVVLSFTDTKLYAYLCKRIYSLSLHTQTTICVFIRTRSNSCFETSEMMRGRVRFFSKSTCCCGWHDGINCARTSRVNCLQGKRIPTWGIFSVRWAQVTEKHNKILSNPKQEYRKHERGRVAFQDEKVGGQNTQVEKWKMASFLPACPIQQAEAKAGKVWGRIMAICRRFRLAAFERMVGNVQCDFKCHEY
jgi:hypothetical protein